MNELTTYQKTDIRVDHQVVIRSTAVFDPRYVSVLRNCKEANSKIKSCAWSGHPFRAQRDTFSGTKDFVMSSLHCRHQGAPSTPYLSCGCRIRSENQRWIEQQDRALQNGCSRLRRYRCTETGTHGTGIKKLCVQDWYGLRLVTTVGN